MKRCSCGRQITQRATKCVWCANAGKGRTHGGARTSEWNAWNNMRYRCSNPKHPDYKYYGARGIKVCKRWLRFENFLADMGCRPSPKHTLERKDNGGDYKPTNCCWATRKEQILNRRNTVWIVLSCRVMSLSDWACSVGMDPKTIGWRLRKGWPVEEAVYGRRTR